MTGESDPAAFWIDETDVERIFLSCGGVATMAAVLGGVCGTGNGEDGDVGFASGCFGISGVSAAGEPIVSPESLIPGVCSAETARDFGGSDSGGGTGGGDTVTGTDDGGSGEDLPEVPIGE